MINFTHKLLNSGVEMRIIPGEMKKYVLMELRKTNRNNLKFKETYQIWIDISTTEEDLVSLLDEALDSFLSFYSAGERV